MSSNQIHHVLYAILYFQFSNAIKLEIPHIARLQIVQDELNIIYINPEYSEVESNLTNAGHVGALCNVRINIKKSPPPNILLTITPMKQENGVYVTGARTPIKHNVCTYIKKDRLLYPGFVKAGNLPHNCPIKTGEYYLYNYSVPVGDLPPLIPSGKYKLDFEMGSEELKLMKIEWKGTLSQQ